jgi:single-stranded-DNA-specific exonuclease
MDVADDVIELFLTRDAAHARVLAEKLDRLNAERRATESESLAAIEEQLLALRSSAGDYPANCLILDDTTWHRGVLGILASRVVERTGRPALIVTHEKVGEGEWQAHGSGRSVAGFHLLDALAAVDADAARGPIFSRFGGHAHAVGFSLPSRHMAALRERMEQHAVPRLTEEVLWPELRVDAEITLAEITPELWRWLLRCGPYGKGHPEPVFVARNLVLAGPVRLIQEKHVCLEVREPERSERFSALGWSRSVDWVSRCREMGLEAGSRLDLAFRITEKRHERFGGLQLELQALRRA